METLLQRMPFKARKAVFEKLEQIVDIASLSKEERMKYDESIKVYRDHLVTIDFAINKGLQQGREEGMAEGLAKGRKEGMAEGIAQNNRENARKMKEEKIPIYVIARITDLSIDEIENL